jgi:hypothetical protein
MGARASRRSFSHGSPASPQLASRAAKRESVSKAIATSLFGLSRGVVPIGQRVVPLLPESASRAALAGVLRRWPGVWGMFDDGKRIRAARHGYRLAFPDEDADTFTGDWIASRGEDLAACMIYMARVCSGRSSRLVDAGADLDLAKVGPSVIALLHYTIDPVLPLALLAANPERDFCWPLYPLQPGVEDDRALWFTGCRVPDGIAKAFLPVTSSMWLVDALRHLERGGDVFLAMDTPFDRKRRAVTSLRVGQAAMPMASSIECLLRETGAQLLFAWPELGADEAWIPHVDTVTSISALATAATSWIEGNRRHWAGWPYLRWREASVSMRRNVA